LQQSFRQQLRSGHICCPYGERTRSIYQCREGSFRSRAPPWRHRGLSMTSSSALSCTPKGTHGHLCRIATKCHPEDLIKGWSTACTTSWSGCCSISCLHRMSCVVCRVSKSVEGTKKIEGSGEIAFIKRKAQTIYRRQQGCVSPNLQKVASFPILSLLR